MLSRIWLSGWFSCPGFSVTRLVYYYCRGARESWGPRYCLLSTRVRLSFGFSHLNFDRISTVSLPISTCLSLYQLNELYKLKELNKLGYDIFPLLESSILANLELCSTLTD